MKKLSWDWETCVNHPICRVGAYGARKVVRKQESWVCRANAQRAGDNPPWHGAKILVVEDNHLQAEVVSDFLHDCGLEPVCPAGRLKKQEAVVMGVLKWMKDQVSVQFRGIEGVRNPRLSGLPR